MASNTYRPPRAAWSVEAPRTTTRSPSWSPRRTARHSPSLTPSTTSRRSKDSGAVWTKTKARPSSCTRAGLGHGEQLLAAALADGHIHEHAGPQAAFLVVQLEEDPDAAGGLFHHLAHVVEARGEVLVLVGLAAHQRAGGGLDAGHVVLEDTGLDPEDGRIQHGEERARWIHLLAHGGARLHQHPIDGGGEGEARGALALARAGEHVPGGAGAVELFLRGTHGEGGLLHLLLGDDALQGLEPGQVPAGLLQRGLGTGGLGLGLDVIGGQAGGLGGGEALLNGGEHLTLLHALAHEGHAAPSGGDDARDRRGHLGIPIRAGE